MSSYKNWHEKGEEIRSMLAMKTEESKVWKWKRQIFYTHLSCRVICVSERRPLSEFFEGLRAYFLVCSWELLISKGSHVHAQLLQSCPTLCDPMDHSLPGSSVHGIFQARILEWLPFPTPGDLPNPGIETASLTSLALAGGSFFN